MSQEERRIRIARLRLSSTQDDDEPVSGRILWTQIIPAVRASNAAQAAAMKARRGPPKPPPLRVTSPTRIARRLDQRTERRRHLRELWIWLGVYVVAAAVASIAALT